ncbi:MAG: hypothetical protein ACKV19_00630 [Verrucomicrobiales bacterium]
MNRSTPIRPELDHELQCWQRQSESKIPPGPPRHRIHELPGLAAENEAASPPTIDEELPVSAPDLEPLINPDEVSHEEEPPAAPQQGPVEDVVLERFEDDGGPADGETAGIESARAPSTDPTVACASVPRRPAIPSLLQRTSDRPSGLSL